MAEEKESNNYISLIETTKYCGYSQEYLSLRARQGKLKAVKFGRNWVTTKEWLEEYLVVVEEYKNNLKIGEIKEQKEIKRIKKEVFPPENLPVGDFQFVPVLPLPKKRFLTFRFGLAAALILVLLIAGGIFGKIFFENIENLSFFAATLGEDKGIFGDNLLEVFKEYWLWVRNKICVLGRAIANLWQEPEGIVKEEEPIIIKPGEREGMVVVLSTEKDEEVKEKIKAAFSDEVEVKPKDKESGIIVPIFRERRGEDYLYILVPINPIK